MIRALATAAALAASLTIALAIRQGDQAALAKCQELHSSQTCLHILSR